MAAWTHIGNATITLPDAVATFSSISASYDHLCLKISARTDQVAVVGGMGMKFNSATTNYSETRLTASTSTPTSSRKTGESILRAWGNACGASALADTFSTTTVWIPNYANTANYKSFIAQSAVENNSSTTDFNLMLDAGLWSDNAAINRIDISLLSGDDFVANSTFDLYGILGA